MRELAQSQLQTPADEEIVYVGTRLTFEGEQLFGLKAHDRRQHTYIIGKSGSGKTTALRNILIQDLHANQGLALLDPHGDLATDILEHIPPNRTGDVIYFNPSDRDHPISFNLFATTDTESRHLVASSIVTALKSIWRDSWGPRLEYILFAAVAALLECQNTSLLGLPRLLIDGDYRDWVLRQVRDPVVRSFWIDEFAHYDSRFMREAISPVQNKIGQLLMSPGLRNILGQVKSTVNIRYIMDHHKIFIANLSKGTIGADKANLLGALLVSQFQQASMGRAAAPEDRRPDFHLIIDEFQNFSTDSVISILSESRKYHLCLTLAHQYIDQLPVGVAEGVFGNVGTLMSFRVSEKDASILSREFGGHYDLDLYSTLDNHHVVVKLLSDGRYGEPFLATMLPPLSTRYGRGANIIQRSRERYTAPRHVVEDKIERWMRGTTKD